MRKLLLPILLGLLIPITASAQNYPQMNEADMGNMMQQMQAMQQCMQSVDQARLEALSAEAQQMQAEIAGLCAAGKRDAAMNKAMSYGQKFADDPEVKKMRKCGEMMQGMLPQMQYDFDLKKEENKHICDS